MFAFIHAEKASYSISLLCRVLGVSRSGYYRWLTANPSARGQSNIKLTGMIQRVFDSHKARYGSLRITRELRARGEQVGHNRVARIMRQEGMVARQPRRFRHTTDSRHSHRIAPNLLKRNFSTSAANQAWVGDMTYISTADGWLFLAVLVDLFSRRVVGWALSDTINTELALDALQRAAKGRPGHTGLIHHTDRDCRYASDDYQAAFQRMGLTPSMSRKGNCWDSDNIGACHGKAA